MKGKKYLYVLVYLCALSLLSGFAINDGTSVSINNIFVQPGGNNSNIILETSSPISVLNSCYSKSLPSTIVIDLNGVKSWQEPQLNLEKSSLIDKLRMEKGEADSIRLFIDLKEKVPYRIYPQKESTIIELNKIQRAGTLHTLNNEIKRELEKNPQHNIYLRRIDVSESNDKIDITAKLSDKAIPNVFALNNPSRLVVDLYNTLHSQESLNYSINKLGVKKIRTSQFQISNPYTITRMVFDLTEPKFYSLTSKKNELVVSFYKDMSFPSSSKIAVSTIKNIETNSSPNEVEQPVKNESKPVKKAVPTKIKTPVENKKTKEKSLSKNVNIPKLPASTNTNSVQDVSQKKQFVPKTIAETEEKYSGQLISPRFKDADIRDVILSIGHFVQLNIVFDPEVRGTVTCDFTDVPWDQFIDIILKQNKLGKTIEGNVLRIGPIGVLTREQEEQRKLKESQELAGPLVVKTFRLSYSKASDVQTLIGSKISERGEIIVDERTNTLIISEVKDKIDILERLINVFDTATPQVSIEARIVEATSTFIRNLGVQWGWRGVADPFYGNQTSLQFPNKILSDGALIPQGIVTKGIGGPLGGYAINLPAPAFSTAVGLSLSNILDTFSLDVAISALETSGEGRIISSPKVTTQNNQPAEIIQGRQIPVQTVANFTVTTRYVNAALELKATPQITAEGTIIMTIEIQNNAADFANLVNGIPPITTQSAKTTVMIPDGGTTVIGGIYRTEDSITRERVPFLHKIPILGNLFRSFARTKQNRELLIFITPRIIK